MELFGNKHITLIDFIITAHCETYLSSVHFTLIDPGFERVNNNVKPSDESTHVFIEKNLQDVLSDIFDELKANDILLGLNINKDAA